MAETSSRPLFARMSVSDVLFGPQSNILHWAFDSRTLMAWVAIWGEFTMEQHASLPEDLNSRSTALLVGRAKLGDREAWKELVDRYYDAWLARYHGNLGTELRRIYDTEDLVQSAVADAFKKISELRDESSFFVWVTAILRHKVAVRYRENKRFRPLEAAGCKEHGSPDLRFVDPADRVEFVDTYLSTLDRIIALFPDRPKWMAAVVMRYLDGLEVPEIARRLGIPERTAFHWLASGTRFLQERLSNPRAADHGNGEAV